MNIVNSGSGLTRAFVLAILGLTLNACNPMPPAPALTSEGQAPHPSESLIPLK